MEDSPAAPRAVAGFRAVILPTRWTLWSEPPQYVVYWLASVAPAIALTVNAAIDNHLHLGDMIVWGALAVLGILQGEGSRRVERIRRIVDNTPHINLTSAWTFAAVLLLPPALTYALVIVLYAHLAVRCWRRLRATPTYRTVSNGCRTILSCYLAYQMLTFTGVDNIQGAITLGWGSVAGLTWTIAVYFVFAALAAVPGLKPAKKTLTELFGGWVDNILELVTLLTAVIVALLLVGSLPFMAGVSVPLLVFVHRGVLFKQIEITATTDATTGLFNTRGWHSLAADALTKAQREDRRGAVLMADLDHFKKVNDTYGHLAGDAVLRAVAEVLRANVRGYDAVGRLGGEEFVILLPDISTEAAERVGNRICQAVAQLAVPAVTLGGREQVIKNLSVSIGYAPYPEFGFVIDTLLGKADTALYYAKHHGRNQVWRASATA